MMTTIFWILALAAVAVVAHVDGKRAGIEQILRSQGFRYGSYIDGDRVIPFEKSR